MNRILYPLISILIFCCCLFVSLESYIKTKSPISLKPVDEQPVNRVMEHVTPATLIQQQLKLETVKLKESRLYYYYNQNNALAKK
jgi:hypothetical protein